MVESFEGVFAVVVGYGHDLGRVPQPVSILVQEDDEGGNRFLIIAALAIGVGVVPDHARDHVLAGTRRAVDRDGASRLRVGRAPVVGNGELRGVGARVRVGVSGGPPRPGGAVPERP